MDAWGATSISSCYFLPWFDFSLESADVSPSDAMESLVENAWMMVGEGVGEGVEEGVVAECDPVRSVYY
jgi:hypothetical protein